MDERIYTEGYNTDDESYSIISRVRTLFEEGGISEVVAGASRFVKWRYYQEVKWPIEYRWYRFAKGGRTFQFRDAELEYCWHRANQTWNSERAIEIPIVFHILNSVSDDAAVLEVGNVLRQYQDQYRDVSHPVVDKYEDAPGIENVDIVDYNPEKEFELIVSVSTLEHVGFDEPDGSAEKFRDAVESLKGMLAPGGRLVFSVPLGYNEEMESQLDSLIELDDAVYLRRKSSDNMWEQIQELESGKLEYGERYPKANEILIGIISKQ